VTTPSKAQGERRWRQFAIKKDGVTFVNKPPSVENASFILPNPPATATKKYRIFNSKNFGISLAISKTS
jgi:hypothetical protein